MSVYTCCPYMCVQGVLCDLLRICYERQGQRKRSHCRWHPVFGWFEQTTDKRHLEAAPHILKQILLLWKREFVSLLFAPLLALTPAAETTATKVPTSQSEPVMKCILPCLLVYAILNVGASRHITCWVCI